MFGREPVVVSAAISLAIKAVLLAFMAFGVTVTPEQLAAVVFAVDAVLALLIIVLVRPQTVSTITADKQIEIAKASPVTRSTDDIIKEAAK